MITSAHQRRANINVQLERIYDRILALQMDPLGQWCTESEAAERIAELNARADALHAEMEAAR